MGDKLTKADRDNNETYSAAQSKFFRAEKTTRNHDDFKVLTFGIVVAVMILVLPLFNAIGLEKRWYRDLTGVTPFSNIEVLYSVVSEDEQHIMVGGTMSKDRCEFNFDVTNPVAYVTGQYGLRHRLTVDTSPEDHLTQVFNTSRPPSSGPETWGPWVIDKSDVRIFGGSLKATQWEIFVYHNKCPRGPEEQVNLFAEGPWTDINRQFIYPNEERE
jgi:hypothetical protein